MNKKHKYIFKSALIWNKFQYRRRINTNEFFSLFWGGLREIFKNCIKNYEFLLKFRFSN